MHATGLTSDPLPHSPAPTGVPRLAFPHGLLVPELQVLADYVISALAALCKLVHLTPLLILLAQLGGRIVHGLTQTSKLQLSCAVKTNFVWRVRLKEKSSLYVYQLRQLTSHTLWVPYVVYCPLKNQTGPVHRPESHVSMHSM